MKKEVKPFSWIVKIFDCNAQKIKDYDILKYREDDIKKLKKKYTLRRVMRVLYAIAICPIEDLAKFA